MNFVEQVLFISSLDIHLDISAKYDQNTLVIYLDISQYIPEILYSKERSRQMEECTDNRDNASDQNYHRCTVEALKMNILIEINKQVMSCSPTANPSVLVWMVLHSFRGKKQHNLNLKCMSQKGLIGGKGLFLAEQILLELRDIKSSIFGHLFYSQVCIIYRL